MEPVVKKNTLTGYSVALLVSGVVIYFSYAAIQGPFGLLNLFEIETQEARLQAQLDELQHQHAVALNRAHRLSDEFLDLDLLDEQARKVLGLARGDEIIIR